MAAPLIIAVDGPAGSGKSSVCRGVATALNLQYLDTGAMYRAMTWGLLQRGIDIVDTKLVASQCNLVIIDSGTHPSDPTISVDGVDVSAPIRGEEVTAAVSRVSAVPAVRARLVEQQRSLVRLAVAHGQGIVVEGRDITTVVLPDAALKVFLTADERVRASRRAREAGLETQIGVQSTQASMSRRDAIDSSRATSPLVQADDAIVVDTTDMNLQQVIDHVVALAKAAR